MTPLRLQESVLSAKLTVKQLITSLSMNKLWPKATALNWRNEEEFELMLFTDSELHLYCETQTEAEINW